MHCFGLSTWLTFAAGLLADLDENKSSSSSSSNRDFAGLAFDLLKK